MAWRSQNQMRRITLSSPMWRLRSESESSAGFQPAVSQVFNLHRDRIYRHCLASLFDLQDEILRYSRLKTCATPSGYLRPLKIGNHQANSQKSRGPKRMEASLDAI
jgi:hypothetical protein